MISRLFCITHGEYFRCLPFCIHIYDLMCLAEKSRSCRANCRSGVVVFRYISARQPRRRHDVQSLYKYSSRVQASARRKEATLSGYRSRISPVVDKVLPGVCVTNCARASRKTPGDKIPYLLYIPRALFVH